MPFFIVWGNISCYFIGHRFIRLTLRLPDSGSESVEPTEKSVGEGL